MPRKPPEKLSKDAVAQHMSTELQILNQSADHAKDVLSSKVNYFLILVTAVGGGLILLGSMDDLQTFILPIACLVIFLLAVMGFGTLRQGLDTIALAVVYYRRAGRIRKWFVEQEPAMEPYLPFMVADNLPRMSSGAFNLRGTESILLWINASLMGILTGLVTVLIDFYLIRYARAPIPPADYLLALILGGISLSLTWYAQIRYMKEFMQNWEKQQKKLGLIHFPVEIMSEEEFEAYIKR